MITADLNWVAEVETCAVSFSPRECAYRQHQREYAAMRSADEYGWRDRERGQDRREIGEVDAKCIIIGIAVVFGLAVAAIVGRHDPARLGRVGRQRHCQGMKVGCSPGETR